MQVPALNIRDFENARLQDLKQKNNQFLGTVALCSLAPLSMQCIYRDDMISNIRKSVICLAFTYQQSTS